MKRIPELFAVTFMFFTCLFATSVYAQELQPTVVNATIYRIENFVNGKFLSNGDNQNNDARIIFVDGNASSAGQEWAMFPTETDGVFCFLNPTSGKAIDMATGVGYPVQGD